MKSRLGWKADVARKARTDDPANMKRTFAKVGRWARSLDTPSRLALALCGAPLVVMMLTSWSTSVASPPQSVAYVIFRSLMAIPALVVVIPLTGPSQLGLFWFTRHTSARWLQWAFCAVSVLLLIPYWLFLATTDLTANSTAPIAAVIYPMFLALLSLPPAGIVWWFMRRLHGDGWPD
jgi:hypothetical protein